LWEVQAVRLKVDPPEYFVAPLGKSSASGESCGATAVGDDGDDARTGLVGSRGDALRPPALVGEVARLVGDAARRPGDTTRLVGEVLRGEVLAQEGVARAFIREITFGGSAPDIR
jgi:hypothetical protein